jgi:hypothetical protein
MAGIGEPEQAAAPQPTDAVIQRAPVGHAVVDQMMDEGELVGVGASAQQA